MSDQAPIPARPMAGLFLGGRPLLAPCVPLSLETEASRIGRRHRATVLESNPSTPVLKRMDEPQLAQALLQVVPQPDCFALIVISDPEHRLLRAGKNGQLARDRAQLLRTLPPVLRSTGR
jgi:hypothetical protein